MTDFQSCGQHKRIIACIVFLVAIAISIGGHSEQPDQANAESKWSLEETEQFIRILDGDRELLVYNKQSPPLPAKMDPLYRRSGFLHPVSTPQGRVVTATFPTDHPHQDGIFSAWVRTNFGEREVDFWNLAAGQGFVRHERVVSKFETDQNAGFEVELSHCITGESPMIVLKETWRVTAHQGDDECHVFDIESTQVAATDTPLTVQQYHYGGMAVRGPVDWLSQKRSATKPNESVSSANSSLVRMSNDQASDRKLGNHQPTRWVTMSGTLKNASAEAGPASITVMGHPDNNRAPQAARLHPTKPYFCFAPCVSGEFQISPDQPLRSAYRFLVRDSAPDQKWLESEWEKWVKR